MGTFNPECWVLGFFNSSFHKMWAFKRNIPTVMLIFFNPCPQGGWELLLDLPELGHSPPQYPTEPASTQFPPKHQRQETWFQVPALSLTPWPWPTPAPSTSVFTCMMLHGVVPTPPAFPWLTASTQSQGYPIFYRPDPWQGHRAGQGKGGRGGEQWILCFVLFLKKIQFISGLQKLSEHCCAPFAHLFVQSTRLQGWAQKLLPC